MQYISSNLINLCFFWGRARAGSSLAKWPTCELDISYNCAGSNVCESVCGGAVGGNLVIEASCRRRGGSRGAFIFYCHCLFRCPPKPQPANPPTHI